MLQAPRGSLRRRTGVVDLDPAELAPGQDQQSPAGQEKCRRWCRAGPCRHSYAGGLGITAAAQQLVGQMLIILDHSTAGAHFVDRPTLVARLIEGCGISDRLEDTHPLLLAEFTNEGELLVIVIAPAVILGR